LTYWSANSSKIKGASQFSYLKGVIMVKIAGGRGFCEGNSMRDGRRCGGSETQLQVNPDLSDLRKILTLCGIPPSSHAKAGNHSRVAEDFLQTRRFFAQLRTMRSSCSK
jgi:hypothetical protein